ncbi:odorant receptor 22b-like [Macrosteles quadrilineatus]|uniref:odorant receptor 22b-like n=1 Tax=Macrosteles quadrilineatus TaxID=74068 RepID=UPI0023E0A6E7|nr:odorant receptor 22b-like [Macrosteles quadrilineatus]
MDPANLSRADDTKKNFEARRKSLKSKSPFNKVKENEDLKIRRTDEQVKEFLKDIVEKHINIIKNVQLTEKTYRYSILFFTQIVVILIALAIPQLRLNADILSPEAFKLVVVVFCESLGTVGLFNYSGQILLDESEALRQALYNCDWTDKPRSLRRGLLIMQIMASKPLKLTTGGIYTLSMETFASVLSATYSYSRITHSFKSE